MTEVTPELVPGVATEPDEPGPSTRTDAELEVERELDELVADAPRVGIVSATRAEMDALDEARAVLDERGILHEVRVLDPEDEPQPVADYARNAHMRGLQVIIAAAGVTVELPGAIAEHTDLPVVGVPLAVDDVDAVLPPAPQIGGGPVAWVGVNAARDAGVLAARILGSAPSAGGATTAEA